MRPRGLRRYQLMMLLGAHGEEAVHPVHQVVAEDKNHRRFLSVSPDVYA